MHVTFNSYYLKEEIICEMLEEICSPALVSSDGPLVSAGVRAHLNSGLDQTRVLLKIRVSVLLQMNSGADHFSVSADRIYTDQREEENGFRVDSNSTLQLAPP